MKEEREKSTSVSFDFWKVVYFHVTFKSINKIIESDLTCVIYLFLVRKIIYYEEYIF